MSPYPSAKTIYARTSSPGVAGAAWHSLLWLVIANAIGVLIALPLLAKYEKTMPLPKSIAEAVLSKSRGDYHA